MRHSKFKNTGILFELLTKQVTADIISGKKSSKASEILHKFFKVDTELGKEWQLYNKLLSENLKTESYAERYYSTVLDARKKLNDKLLLQEKYELIKEIKNAYPIEEMLKSPVKNYKISASIYKLFENATSDIKFDIDEIYTAKNSIVEHLINKKSLLKEDDSILDVYKAQSEDIRLLTYKLLVEKLNEKYSSVLDDEQRKILKEYICNVANTNKFDVLVKEHINKIKTKLKSLITTIEDSDVIKIKINEVVNQLDKINPDKIVKDNHVTVLMLSYELLKEINKTIGNKVI
jgi:hypothetical protein